MQNAKFCKDARMPTNLNVKYLGTCTCKSYIQGHFVNSNTLSTISSPVGICHTKSKTFTVFNAMWRFLAVSLPFCIGGTRAAASAHKTVIPVRKNYSNVIIFYITYTIPNLKSYKYFQLLTDQCC